MNRTLLFGMSGLLLLLASSPSRAEDIGARIEWSDRVELTTPVSGVVAEVDADTGDRVKRGAVLLKLEQEPFVTLVKQAKAAVARNKVIRAEAQRELDRNQEMYDQTMLSSHDLELTKIALKTADADLRSAQTKLDQANYALRKSVLTAPFSGAIIKRNASIGMTVVSRLQITPLFVLVSTDKYVARAVLNEKQFQSVKQFKKLDVTYGGKRYSGNVQFQLPDNSSSHPQDFVLDVSFQPEAGEVVFAGESATINLP